MARTLPEIEHLVRRAGFGGSPDELSNYADMGYAAAVESLINFTPTGADSIDNAIRTPGFVGVTSTRAFEPQTNIADTRQRWLFRMVHSPAPLQENSRCSGTTTLRPATTRSTASSAPRTPRG